MRKAFTLVEIISVMGMMLLLFGISLPVYQSLMFGSDVENAQKILVSTLRTAQVQSMAVQDDSKWGVHITSTQLVLFQGGSYLTRVQAYDIPYSLPSNLTVTSPGDIVFTKVYGLPETIGTITITKNEKLTTIIINSRGVQTY